MRHPDSTSTVLIVDDMPGNIQVLSNILYQHGINVAIAQSGEEALRVIARTLPDLILLDILMPEMDGFAVCQRLKRDSAARDIPVIFLTAKTETEDMTKGFELGAVDYVTKPFHPAELVSRVRTHLELKRSRDLLTAQNQQLAEQNQELHNLYALKEQYFSETLHASEQQYRLLAEHVADGIGIIQAETWVFVNTALASMLGYTTKQLIGKPPVDLFHDDYQTQLMAVSQQSAQEGAEPQHWPLLQYVVRSDQREIWMEGRQSLFTWQGKPAILINVRDITRQKLREMEIEEEREQLRRENLQLRSTMKDRYQFGEIIGKSLAMQEVYELILKAAASESDVLIYGESGTGKELVAQTIHQLGERQQKAFVPVNCGAIPESLFEREFFGHRKGAFTGADKDNEGFFGAAHRGTLFLDEVGELSLAMQVKLLRVIETGEYTPLGESHPKIADARIIAATHKNLETLVQQDLMREDFFYRIHVIVIRVPPLRSRKEDIPLLIDRFLEQHPGKDVPRRLPGRVLEVLYEYDWPGNIRQLQNTLARYLTVGQLDFVSPRGSTDVTAMQQRLSESAGQGVSLNDAVERLEKQLILVTLEQHRWHRKDTADALAIPRKTLFRKMKKYGLS